CSEDTVGRTYHITSNTVGAAPTDNLFGPGGYLEFVGVGGTLTIQTGGGADTAYVVPNAVTNLSIQAFSPTTTPGDSITLATADATGTTFTPGVTGAGTYTFTNRQQVAFTGIETRSTDGARPAIVAS